MLEIQSDLSMALPAGRFGGKAAGLALLFRAGYTIPPTLAVEGALSGAEVEDPDFQTALCEAMRPFERSGMYHVAVRSSCTAEDGFSESMAGHFDTFLGDMSFSQVIGNMKQMIAGLGRGRKHAGKMGIVIQELVDADYSGVLFSSDPLTYSKRTMVLSMACGTGEKLVSGADGGTDLVVRVQEDEFEFEGLNGQSPPPALLELAERTKALERVLNYPVDVEWAVSGGRLVFLQCRPLASITKVPSTVRRVSKMDLAGLPNQLVDHGKVKLRLSAEETGVLISDAYVRVHNGCGKEDGFAGEIARSELCRGYSVVLISPRTLWGKVVRAFVGENGLKPEEGGPGWEIQSQPKYRSIRSCLEDYAQMAEEEYWLSAAIVQEIYDPLYTGIMRRVPGGLLIEITRGHFLTKGVVPASQYVVNFEGSLSTKNEVCQHTWFKILEGRVIRCTSEEGAPVSLSEGQLAALCQFYRRFMPSEEAVVEFGILEEPGGEIRPYLIDYVDDQGSSELSTTDIEEGIISRGKVTGRAVYVPEGDGSSLDLHFYDSAPGQERVDQSLIFFCKRPEISLLSLLERYGPEKIGFVFEKGSILCHFAVVLREKGIPAVKTGTFLEMPAPGESCTVDAQTARLRGEERVVR